MVDSRVQVTGSLKVCWPRDAQDAGVAAAPLRPDLPAVETVVNNAWVTCVLDGHWMAAYRLVAQDGRLVVGELRVYPRPRRRASGGTWAAGEWPGILKGIYAVVPPFGLSATIMKQVRLGADVTGGRAVLDWWERQPRVQGGLRRLLTTWAVEDTEKPASRETGRPGLPRQHYERVVRAYRAALAAHSRRPVQDAARKLRMDPATVRDRLRRARVLGLLGSTKRGRAAA